MKFENRIKIKKINSKAYGCLFHRVKKGDVLVISHNSNRHPRRSTIPHYTVTNMTTLERRTINANQLESGLSHLDFIPA